MYILSEHMMCEPSLRPFHLLVIVITFYMSNMVLDDGKAVTKEVGDSVANQNTT